MQRVEPKLLLTITIHLDFIALAPHVKSSRTNSSPQTVIIDSEQRLHDLTKKLENVIIMNQRVTDIKQILSIRAEGTVNNQEVLTFINERLNANHALSNFKNYIQINLGIIKTYPSALGIDLRM